MLVGAAAAYPRRESRIQHTVLYCVVLYCTALHCIVCIALSVSYGDVLYVLYGVVCIVLLYCCRCWCCQSFQQHADPPYGSARDNQIRRLALNPRALRELLPNCWRVVAAMEKVLGSGRSNWNTNGSAVTAASGYRPSPSILNASLNTWYT